MSMAKYLDRTATCTGCVLAAALSWGQPVRAQIVAGQVTQSGRGVPLAGVYVYLTDEAGADAASALTDSIGNFVLKAPAPGRYDLHAETIGHAPFVAPGLILTASGVARKDVALDVRAIDLSGIVARVESRCRNGPPAAPVTRELWEAARTALRVTRWSQEEGALRFGLLREQRELDPLTLEVKSEVAQSRTGYFTGSPYVALSADRLAEHGFVIREPDGSLEYFAPDAAVLLSASFLENHCFRVALPTAADPELVGLAFEPVVGRDVPEVEGVLWIHRVTSELKRLDFRYVNLPFDDPVQSDHVGGRVSFERLANGMWIVRRWRIRMPVVSVGRRGGALSNRQLEVSALNEVRGEVLAVHGRRGQVLADAAGAILFGAVFDGSASTPLPATEIALLGTRHAVVADDSGQYRFTNVADGVYTVRFRHPTLAALGIAAFGTRSVELVSGTATRLPLHVTPAAAAAAACRAIGWTGEGSPVLVHGVVRDTAGRSVENAMIAVRQSTGDLSDDPIVTNQFGSYYFCTYSRVEPIELAAVAPSAIAVPPDSAHVRGDASEPGFLRVDVAVFQPRVGIESANWRPGVVGTVRGAGDPVPGALIVLVDSTGRQLASAIADEAGAFALVHPGPAGVYRLSVEHIGYATTRQDLTLAVGEAVTIDVRLATRALAIEGIRVTARRQGFLAEAGFYRRMDRGAGWFVDSDEIDRRKPSRVTDLLRGAAGVRVVPQGTFGSDIRINSTQRLQGDCPPTIFVDGVKVRSSPEAQPAITDLVDAASIAALEVLRRPSEVPAEFGGSDAACGVVLVWLKR